MDESCKAPPEAELPHSGASTRRPNVAPCSGSGSDPDQPGTGSGRSRRYDVNRLELDPQLLPISRRLRLLPLYGAPLPAMPALRAGGFFIEPGSSIRINYDWDDVNFTLILVRRENGAVVAVWVDTDYPEQGCCYRPRRELYVVPPLSDVPPASPAEAELLRWIDPMWRRVALASLLAVVPICLYRVQRRFREPVG